MSWASVWGLGDWFFEDLSDKKPSYFAGDAYRLALADSDDDEIQTTILSRPTP